MRVQQKFYAIYQIKVSLRLEVHKVTYRLSTSAKMRAASAEVLLSLIYCTTQSTRWSLKDPLITWCNRSDEIISWISARGKPSVNGYIQGNQYIYMIIYTETQYLQSDRQRYQNYPIILALCKPSEELRYAHVNGDLLESRGHRLALGIYMQIMREISWWLQKNITEDTILERYMQAKLALGSLRCMGQAHRSHGGNGHLHIALLEASPYRDEEAKRCGAARCGRVVGETGGRRGRLCIHAMLEFI